MGEGKQVLFFFNLKFSPFHFFVLFLFTEKDVRLQEGPHRTRGVAGRCVPSCSCSPVPHANPCCKQRPRKDPQPFRLGLLLNCLSGLQNARFWRNSVMSTDFSFPRSPPCTDVSYGRGDAMKRGAAWEAGVAYGCGSEWF